jgi:hypothetical protein
LTSAVQQRPAVRRDLGPWVFNLHRTSIEPAIGGNVRTYFVRVGWTAGTFGYWQLRNAYVYASVNRGQWQLLRRAGAFVAAGNTIAFAVRVDDVTGVSSPWAYSYTETIS